MSDTKDQDRKTKTLTLGKGKSTLRANRPAGEQVRQSFSHGRSKAVQVEHKQRKRVAEGGNPALADGGAAARRAAEGLPGRSARSGKPAAGGGRGLSQAEREHRERALRAMREEAFKREAEEAKRRDAEAARKAAEEAARQEADTLAEAAASAEPEILDAETLRQRELAELRAIEEAESKRKAEEAKQREAEDRKRKAEEEVAKAEEERRKAAADRSAQAAMAKAGAAGLTETEETPASRGKKGRGGSGADRARPASRGKGEPRRRQSGKLNVSQVLSDDGEEGTRGRSLSAMRRARERERMRAEQASQEKVVRDVVIPDVITVGELANRMAERSADVIKSLMRMGMMATINQSIDADTAQLVVEEFGHKVQRVSESDVEAGIEGEADTDADLLPRPPVVTIMGHVDHGKTSLLDALRETDVVSREAGGITQHIGAYQITMPAGDRITFIDTPGHAAFTEMRARGANTTDVVVLVVAADDSVMPQTIEAISHAKAAGVPMIVAVNKVDLPDANPMKVKSELLSYDVQVEDMGGEVQCVEVSAKEGIGLDKLEESILLQAEILELKANPGRAAAGSVVEAKLERGRGAVATVLIQKGTLKVGDVFVTGAHWGRVRALIDDRGQQIDEAPPSFPVEVLGLNGTPQAGDDFVVVEDEGRARDIAEYRDRKRREKEQVARGRGTLEQMFAQAAKGEVKELPVVIKGDVQGSVEAIAASLLKLTEDNAEVQTRILHSGVGAINESDVTLAASTGAMIIGFNVRANPQARDTAKRDDVEIRYYSIIYNVIDDVKQALSGLLAPTTKETFIGYAEIRQVFNITKVGKVAGCYITEGIVRRGAGVRLLRDNVVIHEGKLKTLKRFKDEVREAREGYECGMAFENYDDIREGDVIECFEIEEVAREL